MTYSIFAEGLVKRFGETRALDGVDLRVRTGTGSACSARTARASR
jgi:oleandomycin transport system ATP-binding protein